MRPEWKFTVTLFRASLHDHSLTLSSKGVGVCRAVKRSNWYVEMDPEEKVKMALLLDELKDAGKEEDVQAFDLILCELYDWADEDRVWLA